MGVRDEEISRLIKYAEAMGVKVIFNRWSRENSANWTTDGTEITVFTKTNKSKTDVILSLIHELGHHIWFIHEKDRRPDLKFEEAIDRQNLFTDNIYDTPPPKKLREKILSCEVAGTKYWETIWKDTNIKLPKWKMYAAMELDLWMYEQYVETGDFPKGKFKEEAKLRIKEKYKNVEYK